MHDVMTQFMRQRKADAARRGYPVVVQNSPALPPGLSNKRPFELWNVGCLNLCYRICTAELRCIAQGDVLNRYRKAIVAKGGTEKA